MREVTLTPWEFKWCVDVANARMTVSNEKGMNHASTYERGYLARMQDEIAGACGEMVVCKALGRYWSPTVNTFHGVADIAPNLEVRTTVRPDGCLIVRDNDPDDRFYFLVIGEAPTFRVAGWMKGSEAKRDEWVRDPGVKRASWFVPQDQLKPLPEREK